jgi:hypothetical protein
VHHREKRVVHLDLLIFETPEIMDLNVISGAGEKMIHEKNLRRKIS